MPTFDDYIKRVHRYIDLLRVQGRAVTTARYTESPEQLRETLPIRVGEKANAGIILRGDTFMELGNPAQGSCSHLLWTTDPALVEDGRVTVIGPDIPESKGGSLPFGQVLMLGGTDLKDDDQERLQQAQHISDRIEGYMVRSTAEHIWSRVSNDAAAKGFDLQTLGKTLMNFVKSDVSSVTSMEILFMTSAKEDVAGLDSIANETKSISREMIKETWKARGFDLDCDVDCSSCHDEPVCDGIRDIIRTDSDDDDEEESTVSS